MPSPCRSRTSTAAWSSTATGSATSCCGATTSWARRGLRLPEGKSELVLSTTLDYAPNWLVTSVDDAVEAVVAAGGVVLAAPTPIPVGRSAVVRDVFGNALILIDLTAGHYATDASGRVIGVTRAAS